MNREKAIKIFKRLKENAPNEMHLETVGTAQELFDMAIQALSQEPTDTWSIKDVADTFKKHGLIREQEPCDDAISRILKRMWNCRGKHTTSIDKVAMEQIIRDELPSVTQKSGKWDRLYSWLNDMRLGIAPDETVYDDTERVVRESQVDILDEIMEWMIKDRG